MVYVPECREAFVAMMKKEIIDFARPISLRQHWAGKEEGFASWHVQSRYKDFHAGWQAGLAAALKSI